VPLALHALAREVDRSVGLLLHSTLDLPDFVPTALGLVEPRAALEVVAAWVTGGALVLAVLAAARRRARGVPVAESLARDAGLFAPLLLRPLLTLLALGSLAARPAFPYAFTLPVALTQDLGIAQDVAAGAAILATLLPLRGLPRVVAPGAGAVFLIAFLGYALMVPEWARVAAGHPGNEPKYLRMGLALGHRLSLDVTGADVPMEQLPVEPLRPAFARAAATLGGESVGLLSALVSGPEAWDERAIRATRLGRQTIYGKDGGIFHVLAPGPSLLLAPTLRIDRALNLSRDTPGRLQITLLAWNALGAALVAAAFLLARDACGSAGLAAGLAGFFALMPPFVFYPYQFFPEMPGALAIALLLRLLLYRERWSAATCLWAGLLLAGLPWLHQKFLPVWLALGAMALWKAVDQLVSARALLLLLLPQAASLYLTALLNFAVTGSPRPDALFLAWGPRGISSATLGQGLFGLLFDQRYGLLPYAPLYLLALAGALLPGSRSARLRLALPAAAVYYLTVAAADDWHGAVSNLGRYLMPLLPMAIAFLALALREAGARRGVLTLALALAGWTALFAHALWLDPHAANEAIRLLQRSAFADGGVYVPNLFLKRLADGAEALPAQLVLWPALALALALFVRRAAAGRDGQRALTSLASFCAVLLAAAFVLELWPSRYHAPRLRGALELRPGAIAFVQAGGRSESGVLLVDGREVVLLVRSREPLASLEATASGRGTLRLPGRAPLAADERGTALLLPLEPLGTFTGRRGVSETLALARLETRPEGVLALRLRASP